MVSLRFQEGQRLPAEVLGIVAAYLKIEGQDLSCANLNMASRTLRTETLGTLWETISLPRLYRSPFSGNCEAYKEYLQRMLNRPGAIKYTK
jgi:hypothetical protein